ncbi:MAG: PKD domain-containing protein, partial [Bacteroidia bacterium]
PAVAEFEPVLNCDNPYTVTFDNNSIAANTYTWDFGDGSPLSTEFEPTHTYLLPGYYEVELTVTNDTTSCIHSEIENFTITDPLAAFVAANSSGCGPLTVNFTESSTDAVAWYWDFGDGSTTTEQNPTHIYTVQGTYDVSLTITDLNGCSDTLINLDMVVVTGSIPDFEITSTAGCDSLAVTFNDISSPPGSVLTWNWDFGDGGTSTQQNPTHIYQNAGLYDVSLTITDDAGCTNTSAQNDFVNYIPYPTPNFVASQIAACPNQDITFNNLSSPDAVSFEWDFGDGATSTDTTPTHAYAAPGVYTVTLAAANSNGCDSSTTFLNYITVEEPTASFSAFPTVAFCPPLLVNFTDLSVGNIVAWNWDFGDGSFSTVQNPAHVYTIPGLFDVRLIITNSFGCVDTVLMPGIINLSGPSGTFSFAPDSAGCLPFTVTFEASSTNATTFTWDFGDGNLGNGQIAAHQYTQSGNFFPSLILQDANGCSFVIPGTGSISVSPLAVDAGADVATCGGDSVQLSAIGGAIYAWNPTTGLSNPNIANPLAAPSATTKYYVTVTDGDCQNIDSVTVTVGNTATAAFNFNTVCAGDTTFFTDLSLNGGDSIVTWQWDLGDGTTSQLQNPAHLYSQGGTYAVELYVATTNGCDNAITTNVMVNSNPVAAFSAPDVCLNDTSIFTDLSTIATGNIVSWNWDMSDGTIFFTPNAEHFFAIDSTFTVSLVVTGNGGCSDSIAQTITIHPLPAADFSVEDVCITQVSIFSDSTSINSGSIADYQWTFGNGNTSTLQNPTQVYVSPGTYTVTLLTTSDFGCVDSTSGSTTIFPNPVSSFAANSDSSCTYPVTVGFSNSSTGATLYNWTFGNGDSSAVFNPSVVYDTSGNYLVTLLVTNPFGCTDTSSAIYNVYPIPRADFSVSATEGCQPLSITFDSGLSENALTYSWTFNNGSTSTDVNPTTVYTDPGVYGVSLTVVGEGGCIDSVSYANLITVFENPTAAFDYHVVNEPNIDGTTEFTNLSSPIISSHWDFGDGGSSNETNPTHQFGNYGAYPVMLIVTDFRGCIDTALYNIFVDFFSGLWVPNAFIPQGGEGHNIFLPKGTGLKTYRMQIFDTWGNLLFETDKLENGQPAEGWNGIHKGELLPQNAYVWHITARFGDGKLWQGKVYENGQRSTTGSVTLLR